MEDILKKALRQYRHNAGSGFTFRYDMKEIDKTFDDLRKLVEEFDDGISLDELPGWFERLQKLAGMNKGGRLMNMYVCKHCGEQHNKPRTHNCYGKLLKENKRLRGALKEVADNVIFNTDVAISMREVATGALADTEQKSDGESR